MENLYNRELPRKEEGDWRKKIGHQAAIVLVSAGLLSGAVSESAEAGERADQMYTYEELFEGYESFSKDEAINAYSQVIAFAKAFAFSVQKMGNEGGGVTTQAHLDDLKEMLGKHRTNITDAMNVAAVRSGEVPGTPEFQETSNTLFQMLGEATAALSVAEQAIIEIQERIDDEVQI